MEEQEFLEAESNLKDLISEYLTYQDSPVDRSPYHFYNGMFDSGSRRRGSGGGGARASRDDPKRGKGWGT